jgi:hypothetical protein
MILIISPTPINKTSSDGFLSRALCIDNIIKNYNRCYLELYYEPQDFLDGPKEIIQNNNGYRLNLAALSHQSFFIKLVLSADLIYAHSIYNAQFLVPFLETKKIILDLHGAVPDENALYQRKDLESYYQEIEMLAVNNSNRIISVSKSMTSYYQKKYNLPVEKFIEIPHIDLNIPDILESTTPVIKPTIIYSGGIQTWQCLEEVIEFVNKSGVKFNYIFLTPNIEEIREKITNTECHIEFYFSSNKQDLINYYNKAQFGFILREDNIVNHVACPTKIIDYLQFGILPIVKSSKIGDFERLGFKYFFLNELDQVVKYTEKELLAFRQQNIEVLRQIQNQFKTGSETFLTYIYDEVNCQTTDEAIPHSKQKEEIFKGISFMPFIQVFWDTGSGYSEANSMKQALTKGKQVYIFDLQKSYPTIQQIKTIRIDPINIPSNIIVYNITWHDNHNIQHPAPSYFTNAILSKQSQYSFLSQDPQIYIEIDPISIVNSLSCEILSTSISNDLIVERILALELETQQLRRKLKFYNPKFYFNRILIFFKNILKKF